MSQDLQKRIFDYFDSHAFASNYTVGVNQEGKLVIKGIENPVDISELEKIQTEEELNHFINNYNSNSMDVVQNNIEEPIKPDVVDNTTFETMSDVDLNRVTLEDIKLLVFDLKDLNGLNNTIKSFALNDAGSVDIERALSIVMQNTMDEAVRCIMDNTSFSTNLRDYSIDGKYIGSQLKTLSNQNEILNASFENINIYIEASKLYGKNYSIDQIRDEYIKRVNTLLEDKKRVINNNQALDNQVNTNNQSQNIITDNQNTIQNEENNQAGFADVFVLALIVLVYAAIIVNLVMKLS